MNWVSTVMKLQQDEYGGLNVGYAPSEDLLQEFETSNRCRESMLPTLHHSGVEGLRQEMTDDDFLDFVDFLVFHTSRFNADTKFIRDALEELLHDAGSESTLGIRDGHPSLEKRLPEGVAESAELVISTTEQAGALLAEAWRATFGRSPDPEDAYEKAIKAVEQAGAYIVSPDSTRATLGTMIRDMKAQKDWALDLPASDADVPIKMAEALWYGQEGRHGGKGYRKPTQAEAEAAVMLAVPLVQWYVSGALQRRPSRMPSAGEATDPT